MSKNFHQYIALGDSMSIDLYPALDVGLERGSFEVGAASLLWRNDDDVWPSETGRDFVSLFPGIEHDNLAWDGALSTDVLETQLPRLGRTADTGKATIVTLTAGGNDLLRAHTTDADLDAAVQTTARTIERILDLLDSTFRSSRILLTTVYDPTDGTGLFPGEPDGYPLLPISHLEEVNERIRELAQRSEYADLVDVHRHFLGHGRSAEPDDFWYYRPSPIEPNARGAHEMRRLWLEAIGCYEPQHLAESSVHTLNTLDQTQGEDADGICAHSVGLRGRN